MNKKIMITFGLIFVAHFAHGVGTAAELLQPFKDIDEAVNGMVTTYPYNKDTVTDAAHALWIDNYTKLNKYIAAEVAKDRGFLKNISSTNEKIFTTALLRVYRLSNDLFWAKNAFRPGSTISNDQKIKTLKSLKSELELIKEEKLIESKLVPVTTGLSKDIEITQQIKNLLHMILSKLIDSSEALIRKNVKSPELFGVSK